MIYHIREEVPNTIFDHWKTYKSHTGLERWKQYGNDIQFYACNSGEAYGWWTRFEDRYMLPERHRDPQFIRFGPKSTVPIHRDPKSLAWIAVTIIGDQLIEFYDIDKVKLHETQYSFALVDSKQPHYCDVQGKERVLFRKIYTETTYETLLHLLN